MATAQQIDEWRELDKEVKSRKRKINEIENEINALVAKLKANPYNDQLREQRHKRQKLAEEKADRRQVLNWAADLCDHKHCLGSKRTFKYTDKLKQLIETHVTKYEGIKEYDLVGRHDIHIEGKRLVYWWDGARIVLEDQDNGYCHVENTKTKKDIKLDHVAEYEEVPEWAWPAVKTLRMDWNDGVDEFGEDD